MKVKLTSRKLKIKVFTYFSFIFLDDGTDKPSECIDKFYLHSGNWKIDTYPNHNITRFLCQPESHKFTISCGWRRSAGPTRKYIWLNSWVRRGPSHCQVSHCKRTTILSGLTSVPLVDPLSFNGAQVVCYTWSSCVSLNLVNLFLIFYVHLFTEWSPVRPSLTHFYNKDL